MRKLAIILIMGLLPLQWPVTTHAARWACDVMSKVGYHPLLWRFCELELWMSMGQPAVPDPGGTSGGGEYAATSWNMER